MQLSAAHRLVLRRVKLLAPLGDGDFEALMMFLRARSLSAGELLFRQGDPGETMVIVGEGSLAVRVRRAGGEEVLVAEIGPGEVVGEMAFIDPAARTASVVAVERATVYELSRDGLSTLRRAVPSAGSAVVGAVIRDVTRRLREVDARIELELGAPVAAVSASAAPTAVEAKKSPKTQGTLASRLRRVDEAQSDGERRSVWKFLDRLRGLS